MISVLICTQFEQSSQVLDIHGNEPFELDIHGNKPFELLPVDSQ